MIATDLATSLIDKHVPVHGSVLDPFCGTGRTLFAGGDKVALGVGLDINPLAVLITRAKLASRRSPNLVRLFDSSARVRPATDCSDSFAFASSVRWFPRRAERELAALVEFLNRRQLRGSELVLTAVLLSATIRDVSYARSTGWKLHRMAPLARQHFFVSPIQRFRERLKAVIFSESAKSEKLDVRSYVGDAKNLQAELRSHKINQLFDAVITSPPYGDSATTVQYGGLTRLVWPILQHLDGLHLTQFSGNDVDSHCLGSVETDTPTTVSRKYWKGGRDNPQRSKVRAFLGDLELCLEQIAGCVKVGGKIILVVGRRRKGGYRQNLDLFCIDCLRDHGIKLRSKIERRITGKLLPAVVRPYAASDTRSTRSAPTMRSETVLVFQR